MASSPFACMPTFALQHPIEIYWREGDCVVDWTHTFFYECALDGTNIFSYRSRAEQPLSSLPRAMFFIYRASMYTVNDSSRSCRRYRDWDDYLWCRIFLSIGCANVSLNVSNLDEFFYQLMYTLALFSGVVMILMVGAHSVPIPSSWICLDWLQPSEVQQVVDL